MPGIAVGRGGLGGSFQEGRVLGLALIRRNGEGRSRLHSCETFIPCPRVSDYDLLANAGGSSAAFLIQMRVGALTGPRVQRDDSAPRSGSRRRLPGASARHAKSCRGLLLGLRSARPPPRLPGLEATAFCGFMLRHFLPLMITSARVVCAGAGGGWGREAAVYAPTAVYLVGASTRSTPALPPSPCIADQCKRCSHRASFLCWLGEE